MKLCKDCELGRRSPIMIGISGGACLDAVCHRPVPISPDPVYGNMTRELKRRCRDERKHGWFRDTCGPEGKYWQAKGE